MLFLLLKLHINKKIKEEIFDKYKIEIENKKWSTLFITEHIIIYQQRQETVTTFRISTGHDLLAAHPQKVSLLLSPACVF